MRLALVSKPPPPGWGSGLLDLSHGRRDRTAEESIAALPVSGRKGQALKD
jgi:hypothetical protein